MNPFGLTDNISINTHSSIRIAGSAVFYFDPFRIGEARHDADVIFLTHSHFDHFDPESIEKIVRQGTVIVMPGQMAAEGRALQETLKDAGIVIRTMDPGARMEVRGLTVQAVPAYNLPPKRFHPKENRWNGYLVTDGDRTYYVAGDTDLVPELYAVRCDVALVPAGGTYTMTVEEAAALVNRICPGAAVPTHYGSVAGNTSDGARFKRLVKKEVDVQLLVPEHA